MPNPTPGQVKEDALNQLNKQLSTLVSTTVLFREYNRARRRFRNDHDWSWARKPVQLNFTAYGSTGLFAADLPADMSDKFDIQPFWVSDSYPIDWNKSSYRGLFTPGEDVPRFYIDKIAQKIVSNCGVLTGVNASYAVEQADLPISTASDAIPELFPDAEAVTNLLIAYYWLATQRQMNKHQFFLGEYETIRDDMKNRDAVDEPIDVSVEITSSVTR